MKKSLLRKIALVLVLCFSLSVLAFAADEIDFGKKFDEALSIYTSMTLFAEKEIDYIREALIESFEADPDFFYEFMNRIYEKNDRYSHYMAPQKYEASYGNTNTMVGIGVTISMSEDSEYLTVQSVTSKGPAANAGILPGDKLISADGISLRGFAPVEASMAIRGPEGTYVEIKVLREAETITFKVQRSTLSLSDVNASIIDDKIGYLELKQFDGLRTFVDFIEAYKDFRDAEVNTIILDLRNNRGGSMDCFINIMDNIVPKKDVPYLMTWQAQPMKINVFETEGYGFEINKFVILINEYTASAAELLAGSLQDLGYGVVVGKTSVGKGMGQRHIQTSTGDEAVVTVIDLKLPVSGSYDGIGIKPDFDVDLKYTPYKLPYMTRIVPKTNVSKIKTANVKALEERLSLLGYFYGTPDSNWDEKTVFALNMFCRDMNLPKVTSMCSWELLEEVDEQTKALEQKFLVEDTQLDRAIKLAREYAASDKKAECVDIDLIDFIRN